MRPYITATGMAFGLLALCSIIPSFFLRVFNALDCGADWSSAAPPGRSF